jgi:uncharacterized repeat protein (TIGR03803 family)
MLGGRLEAQTFTTLYSFSGGDGANPQAGLILSANILYGTTFSDGGSGYGTVFRLNTDGTGFATLHNFAGYPSDGAGPQAGLVLSGNMLYGTASAGGNSDNGTVFKLGTDGAGLEILYAFTAFSGSNDYNTNGPTNGDGANPGAGLLLSDNTLYGTAFNGGDWGNGTVFKLNTNGPSSINLHSFTYRISPPILPYENPDGASPQARLILTGNTLYGTAALGGDWGNGTVFAVNSDAMGGTTDTGFTPLHSFAAGAGNPLLNSDGANPEAGLVLSGNTLYGTANAGGSSGQGTVFAIKTNGTGFRVLHSFTATDLSTRTNNDGANPYAGLIVSGNTLYGTTQNGGSSGDGTLFKLNSDGTGFATLYNFTGGSDGANPMAGVILSGNTLYGTTSAGGSSFFGTVFSLSLGPANPPQLTIIPAGANVILTWPTNSTGFALQSTTNLTSTVWTINSTAPVIVNGQNIVTNPISGTMQFYRLSQ